MSRWKLAPRLAIVGGGLAGMAAAVAAVEHGFQVELFEQTQQLGGRAGSFCDPRVGRVSNLPSVGQVCNLPYPAGHLVDFCPHVAMGCCTEFAEFCRRTAVADCFHRSPKLHFFAPDGTRHDFSAVGWLPAPLHLLPGLMRLGYLTWRERWGIARTMLHLAREPISGDSEETIGRWLVRHGQTQQAIDRFWSVVLVSALSETVDRASLSAAQKVFRDGFLASRDAYELVLPRLPLAAIWQRAGQWLSDRGVKLHLGARVDQILGDRCRATEAVLRDGTRTAFDFVIVAVPWRHVGRLFDRPLLEAMPGLSAADQIEPAPITAVHLWFDRPITALPHAALIGRLSQWVFRVDGERGDLHHYAVVISASRGLSGRGHDEVVAEVRRDLAAIWPAAEGAELKHSRVLTNRAAVFSVLPGLDRLRPAQQTPVHNLFLAGDWTSTGWPATMEGAVRSGFLGVDAILKSLGHVGYPLRSS